MVEKELQELGNFYKERMNKRIKIENMVDEYFKMFNRLKMDNSDYGFVMMKQLVIDMGNKFTELGR